MLQSDRQSQLASATGCKNAIGPMSMPVVLTGSVEPDNWMVSPLGGAKCFNVLAQRLVDHRTARRAPERWLAAQTLDACGVATGCTSELSS